MKFLNENEQRGKIRHSIKPHSREKSLVSRKEYPSWIHARYSCVTSSEYGQFSPDGSLFMREILTLKNRIHFKEIPRTWT